jgi:hydroxypyruvate reductase
MIQDTRPEQLLRASFAAAVDAVAAPRVIPAHLPDVPRGRLLVVGAGKAAAAMALAVEQHWPADAPLSGLVITRHGHALPSRRIEVVEAGHPLPDARGTRAAKRLADVLARATPRDYVLALLSGGGSSLLSLPEAGLRLADIQAVTGGLLRSGAPIGAINRVRKHLSRTLGGKLACHLPCAARVLIVSDVVGDDPSTIASGPFHADPSTFAEALDILDTWSVQAPPAVARFLTDGAAGRHAETPKPGAACFARIDTRIIARAGDALAGARVFFQARGIEARILGDAFEDEARRLGQAHAQLARRQRVEPRRPIALLSGGETRVRVTGNGRGGRNSEYLLGLFLGLRGQAGTHALAADTDGIDGSEDNAGAWFGPGHWRRARQAGLDAEEFLARNDAWGFFSAMDSLLLTGPTRTNVNDYRAILIG